jgi:hypothetical protein
MGCGYEVWRGCGGLCLKEGGLKWRVKEGRGTG